MGITRLYAVITFFFNEHFISPALCLFLNFSFGPPHPIWLWHPWSRPIKRMFKCPTDTILYQNDDLPWFIMIMIYNLCTHHVLSWLWQLWSGLLLYHYDCKRFPKWLIIVQLIDERRKYVFPWHQERLLSQWRCFKNRPLPIFSCYQWLYCFSWWNEQLSLQLGFRINTP